MTDEPASNHTPQFERTPDIQGGDWCIAGTRIRVSSVRNFSDAGYTVEQIAAEYPTLTRAQIESAQAHRPPCKPS